MAAFSTVKTTTSPPTSPSRMYLTPLGLSVCSNTIDVLPSATHLWVAPSWLLGLRALAQGGKTSDNLTACCPSSPWYMLLALLSHSSSQDFKCSVRLCCSLSQQNPWTIFNSPAAWKRTKASLYGRAALDGYKWDCPSCQQALRPLACSAEPSQAAVPAHLEAENLRAAVSPATMSNRALLTSPWQLCKHQKALLSI